MSKTQELTLQAFLEDLQLHVSLEQLRLSLIVGKAFCDYANWCANNTCFIGSVSTLPQKHTEAKSFFAHYVDVVLNLVSIGKPLYTCRVRLVNFREVEQHFPADAVLEAIACMEKSAMSQPK